MGYLKLPDEVTEYDWSNPEFQKFTKPVIIRVEDVKKCLHSKNGILNT